jgi:DNA-binding response OmpR family regulator
MAYHRQIFEAVRSRNATEARRIMEAHIQDVQKKLEKNGDFLLTSCDKGTVQTDSEDKR